MKIVVIDNYDSFTYNLVQILGEYDSKLSVFKNDQVTLEKIESIQPTHIVISPGPKTPQHAGLSLAVVKHFLKKYPILGVCLGFQAIALELGATLKLAPKLFHGKTSLISHSKCSLFHGVESPFKAMRYHSWIIEPTQQSQAHFEVIAETDQGIAMALKHKKYPVYGVQFHPESILTPSGKRIIKNFLEGTDKHEIKRIVH